MYHYYLTEEQLKRLCDVYDFDKKEEIIVAHIDDNELYIEYIDKNNCVCDYKPNFDIFTDKEDFDKFKYILWGEK